MGQHRVQDLIVGHPRLTQAKIRERRALFTGRLAWSQARIRDQPDQSGGRAG